MPQAVLHATSRAIRAAATSVRHQLGRLWARRRLRRTLAACGALAFWLLMVYTILAFSIAAEIIHTERRPPVTTPAAADLPYEDVRFRSQDGLALQGWLVAPRLQGSPRRLIILLLDKAVGRGDPAVLRLIETLSDAGLTVLVFDGRGSGVSEGQRYMLGYGERYDLLGALEFARARGYQPATTGVLGLGTGGATALLTAAETTDIAALAVDSSYASLPDYIRATLRRRRLPSALLWGIHQATRLRYGPNLHHIVPEAAVARMTPRPLLVIHGEADQDVPAEHARRLVEAAGPGGATELWIVPGAGHLQAFAQQQEDYLRRVVTFFLQAMGSGYE
ncbi:MAG: hypothetical protein KatS3mg057_2919 [Herpetosiphonaceae bacterium]|nr:MAG: hypothetical protein KatS3mg057_2919 [Herpetosiphonaceae bacterium]